MFFSDTKSLVNPIDITILVFATLILCYVTYKLWDAVCVRIWQFVKYLLHLIWCSFYAVVILALKLSAFAAAIWTLFQYLKGLEEFNSISDSVSQTEEWKALLGAVQRSLIVHYIVKLTPKTELIQLLLSKTYSLILYLISLIPSTS